MHSLINGSKFEKLKVLLPPPMVKKELQARALLPEKETRPIHLTCLRVLLLKSAKLKNSGFLKTWKLLTRKLRD